MHVTHFGFLGPQSHVERGIVDVILKTLVETHDDVDCWTLVGGGEVAGEGAGGDRQLFDSAFDEVAGGGGLGKDDEVGLGIELRGSSDDGANPRDVFGVLPFAGAELRQCNPNMRHAWKDMTVGDGKGR